MYRSRLGLAWSLDLDTHRGQEATPIVVDGVMYFSTAWSKVIAVRAATGEELWSYDPKVPPEWAINACCDVVNRGVAAWHGKIFVGTLDGRLVALDAVSGKVVWETLTVDRKYRYTITGAPRVVKGRVIIGNGGAEMGVRGYVSAYDADTGKLQWRFYTVPGDPSQPFESSALEKAAKTWTGSWWKLGGGGTVWESMAYDPELDLLYIGTGNGTPWNQHARSPGGGDNLYTSSVIALQPDTGVYVWHYQETPADDWDFDSAEQIILANLVIDNVPRKVLLHAPKNGFFYVLDRTNGQLVSAIPYTVVAWADGIDLKTGRPVEHPGARYKEGDPGIPLAPGPLGGHSWRSIRQPTSWPRPCRRSRKSRKLFSRASKDISARGIPSSRKRSGAWSVGVPSTAECFRRRGISFFRGPRKGISKRIAPQREKSCGPPRRKAALWRLPSRTVSTESNTSRLRWAGAACFLLHLEKSR